MKGESKKVVKDNASRPDSDELNRQAQMNAVWRRIEKKARSQGKKKKMDREKLAFRIILPIFILENVALVVLLIMICFGLVGFSSKTREAKTVSVYNVCGQGIVDEYNDILQNYASGSDDYTTRMGDLIDKIESTRYASNDATCQYIILHDAIANADEAKAEDSLGLLEDLSAKGVYPNTSLLGIYPLEILRESVDSIKEYNNDPSSSGNTDGWG